MARQCAEGLRAAGWAGQVRMLGLVTLQTVLQLLCGWWLFRRRRLGEAAMLSWLAASFTLLTTASFAEVKPLLHAEHSLDGGMPSAAAVAQPVWQQI